MKAKATTAAAEKKKFKFELHFKDKTKFFFTEQAARTYAARYGISSYALIPINEVKTYQLFTLVKREGESSLTIAEIVQLFKESIFYELYKGNPEFFERGYWSTYLKDFIVNSKGLNAKYNLCEFKHLADYIYQNQLL